MVSGGVVGVAWWLCLHPAFLAFLGALFAYRVARHYTSVRRALQVASLALPTLSVLAIGAFWAFALGKAVQVRRRPVTVGPERFLGDEGVVRDPHHVFVEGELWRAHRSGGGELVPGDHVRVERVEGLELTVEPLELSALSE